VKSSRKLLVRKQSYGTTCKILKKVTPEKTFQGIVAGNLLPDKTKWVGGKWIPEYFAKVLNAQLD
jgi:hypothetical protein